MLLAVCLQNALHPKNSDRTTAIKEGKYVEIASNNVSAYLSDALRTNLTTDLMSIESEIKSET